MDDLDATAVVTFVPLTRDDFPLLARWLSAEHVQRFWLDRRTDADHLETKYGSRVDGGPVEVFVVHVGGSPIGIVQWCPIDDYAKWPGDLGVEDTIAIDYLIGEVSSVGRGIGARVVDELVKRVYDRFPDTRGIVADPQRDNVASCRVLEKNGFRCRYDGVLPGEPSPTRIYMHTRGA